MPLAGLGAAVMVVVTMALAVRLGAEPVSLLKAVAEPESLDRTILLDVRLPRVALSALAGAGLAAVGAAFQGLLKNPLAEPFLLGVSGGAALGASVAIALGLSAAGIVGAALIPGAALVGGLGATLLVYGIARDARAGPSGTTILLAGVMVNAVASALITVLKTSIPPSRAAQLMRWLTGYIDLPTPLGLLGVSVYVVVGVAALLRDAARLNLLALGDDTAEALGLDVGALTRRVFVTSSCIVGAIVSVTGLIGFVGLMVPHAVRRITGPDHRRVLPFSLAAGATLLVACDLVARLSFRWFERELPVGAVTALVGVPVFLLLLRRTRWAG